MQYPLKPMSLGEILDQAVALLKNHFKLLFRISCYLWLPATVVYTVVVYLLTPANIVPGKPMTEEQFRQWQRSRRSSGS